MDAPKISVAPLSFAISEVMRSSSEHNSLIGIPDGVYSRMVFDSAMKRAVLSCDHAVAAGGDDKLCECVTEVGAFLNIVGSTMVRVSVVDSASIVGYRSRRIEKSNASPGWSRERYFDNQFLLRSYGRHKPDRHITISQ